MKLGKLDSKDAKKDRKHNLPTSVSVPDPDSLSIAFCQSCRRMTTEWEIRRYACCPKCRGIKFTGGWETFWESLKLKWWFWTNAWQVTGKWKGETRLPLS